MYTRGTRSPCRYRSQFGSPSSATLTAQQLKEMGYWARDKIFEHDEHMPILVDYARTRQLDGIVSQVLGYSSQSTLRLRAPRHSCTVSPTVVVLFLVLLLLFLPVRRLLNVYAHFGALMLTTLAHYMSTRYVQLELDDGAQAVRLDAFVKLERHGFHFLAQVKYLLPPPPGGRLLMLAAAGDVGHAERAFVVVHIRHGAPRAGRLHGAHHCAHVRLECQSTVHSLACARTRRAATCRCNTCPWCTTPLSHLRSPTSPCSCCCADLIPSSGCGAVSVA